MEVFDQNQGRFRMFFPEDFHEPDIFFIHLGHGDVRETVDDKTGGVDGGHSFGHFQVELAVAAESQVDGFAVEHPGELGGVGHARA